MAAPVFADSHLRITDVGIHGYLGSYTTAVRVLVVNPSAQSQQVHLRIAVDDVGGSNGATTTEIGLGGGEQRELELPVLMEFGLGTVKAEASAGGAVFGQDKYQGTRGGSNLILLMCAPDSLCKAAQSQIQFSGTIAERVDKNRQIKVEMFNDPRDDWWAYTGANTIVLAMPMANFTAAQRTALEGYVRWGGRLILLEREIKDTAFLAPYRNGPALRSGERVGKGTLIRIGEASGTGLGDAFVGSNLSSMLNETLPIRLEPRGSELFRRRFATLFNFPRLGWVLLWLAAYTTMIGAVNFAVLRHFRRLEYGWASMCGVALLFAAGFYLSAASRRPKDFRLDNLPTYFLDGRSPMAFAEYALRLSSPDRQDILVSVNDPAVLTITSSPGAEPNSQIWAEMNRQRFSRIPGYNVQVGHPIQVPLSLLKWSFHDLRWQGLRVFPGTIHMVSANRLRNDTGRRIEEAAFLDYEQNRVYELPAFAPGEEIQLDGIVPKPLQMEIGAQPWDESGIDQGKLTGRQIAVRTALTYSRVGTVFAGISDGPGLSVGLNIVPEQNIRSLMIVSVGQP
jgi:hypothetical protein